MTITLRYIDGIDELEARWAEIWRLIDAGHQHHAGLLNKELRPHLEGRAHEAILTGMQGRVLWLLVVEQGSEFVGIGSATILTRGRTHPGPIGDTGNVFLEESVRGQGLSTRMYEMRGETLRQRGLALTESAISAANPRAVEIWGNKTWGSTLRRPLRAAVPVPSVSVRRVKDLDKDWAGIWRLLQPSTDVAEADAREQAESTLKKRGAIFVAGPGPTGVIIGKISVNPWLFVERVGMVTNLQTADSEEAELSEALLSRMERWMVSQRATDIETLPIPHGEEQAWSDRGFEPSLFWFQERL